MCNTHINKDVESLLQGSQGSDNSFLNEDVPEAVIDFIMDIEVWSLSCSISFEKKQIKKITYYMAKKIEPRRNLHRIILWVGNTYAILWSFLNYFSSEQRAREGATLRRGIISWDGTFSQSIWQVKIIVRNIQIFIILSLTFHRSPSTQELNPMTSTPKSSKPQQPIHWWSLEIFSSS